MLKKIIIISVVLIVVTVGILFLIPWGEYESTVEKTELTEEVVYEESSNLPPSLGTLEGIYKVNSTESASAEILFLTEGLKDTKGGFEKFEISFEVPADFLQSTLKVIIQTASINSGNAMRDEHLLEPDFFDSKKYPEISFISSSIEMGDTSYVAKGELSLNGTTKALDVPFKHLGGGDKKGKTFEAFEGAFSFDRIKYGQEESSGVGNIVHVNFYCELSKD